MAYRQILNGFAMKSLSKMPNIPDYRLMVGSAEDLASLPTLVQANYIPSNLLAMQADVSKLSNEEIANGIENGTLEVNDFMANIGSIGVGLGGV